MSTVPTFWPWLSLLALGAFHGLNPAMGWLFAVALGLQERRLRGVITALGPIALGHALAIGGAAVVVGALGLIVPQRLLLPGGGAALLAFAAYKVATRFRHPRWIGMRVNGRQLVLWSFLMASAHGAGLMLVPVLVALRGEAMPSALAHAEHLGHAGHDAASPGTDLLPALAAVGLHAAAMLAVAALIAIVVYQRLGVDVLRRAWLNLDIIWVGVLTITGSLALGLALLPMLMPSARSPNDSVVDTPQATLSDFDHPSERAASCLTPRARRSTHDQPTAMRQPARGCIRSYRQRRNTRSP